MPLNTQLSELEYLRGTRCFQTLNKNVNFPVSLTKIISFNTSDWSNMLIDHSEHSIGSRETWQPIRKQLPCCENYFEKLVLEICSACCSQVMMSIYCNDVAVLPLFASQENIQIKHQHLADVVSLDNTNHIHYKANKKIYFRKWGKINDTFIMIVSFGTNLMLHPFYKDIVVVDLLFIGLKTLHLWLNKKNRMVVLRRS